MELKTDQPLDNLQVVIVNWNQPALTIQCLSSVLDNGLSESQLILVDNGSTDNSVYEIRTKFQEIDLIESEINLGFAGGYNLGIKVALSKEADYVLILNNDTILLPGMIDELFSKSMHLNADIASPLIYYAHEPDRIWSAGGYINQFILMPVDAHRTKKPIPKAPIKRDFLTGCALLIKKAVFNQIGFFDESFFLYYEDLDFLLRAKQAKLKAWLIPKSKLLHKNTSSNIYQKSEKVLYWMARSKWLFFKKHACYWQWLFIIPWQCGHFIKTIINLLRGRNFKKIRSFLLGFFLINQQKYGEIYSK